MLDVEKVFPVFPVLDRAMVWSIPSIPNKFHAKKPDSSTRVAQVTCLLEMAKFGPGASKQCAVPRGRLLPRGQSRVPGY